MCEGPWAWYRGTKTSPPSWAHSQGGERSLSPKLRGCSRNPLLWHPQKVIWDSEKEEVHLARTSRRLPGGEADDLAQQKKPSLLLPHQAIPAIPCYGGGRDTSSGPPPSYPLHPMLFLASFPLNLLPLLPGMHIFAWVVPVCSLRSHSSAPHS